VNCTNCGTLLAAGDATCRVCGTPAAQPFDPPADPPTETMPAVLLPPSDPGMQAGAEEIHLAPPVYAPPQPPVAQGTPLPPAHYAASPPPPYAASPPPPYAAPAGYVPGRATTRQRRDGNRRRVIAGAIVGALGGLALAVGAVALLGSGNPDLAGIFGNGAVPPVGSSPGGGGAGAGATPTRAAGADGNFRCTAQAIDAPEAGAWQLFRASFGTRSGFDYLTLHLRQTGRADGQASISAEVMSASDVASRYGLDPPEGADTAMVINLEGPVRIPGSFGGRPRHSALRGFEVLTGDDGTVRVVAGVNGPGCFALVADDWQSGRTSRTTEVTFQIERP
jgi:hypothetical protein